MNSFKWTLILTVMLAQCVVSNLWAANANDETDDVQVEIKAPLQAVNCSGTPASVTVLGMTISVPPGSFDDSSASSRKNGSDDNGATDAANCASLVVGQFVEIKFIGTTLPLVANSVEATGATDIQVKGRIDSVDASTQAISVLGITISIAGAQLNGNDDLSSEHTPLSLANLAIGQFVEATLNAAALPAFAALKVDVKNFNNQISLSFEDRDKNDDNNDDAVEIEIEHSVMVLEPKSNGLGTHRVKKTYSYHFSSLANAVLAIPALPKGTAKITATRTSDGAVAKKTMRVKANQILAGSLKFNTPRGR